MKNTSIATGLLAAAAPIGFVLTHLYASRYEGWGQWATAPIFLLPLGYSLVAALTCLAAVVGKLRHDQSPLFVLSCLVVAASPWLYVLLR